MQGVSLKGRADSAAGMQNGPYSLRIMHSSLHPPFCKWSRDVNRLKTALRMSFQKEFVLVKVAGSCCADDALQFLGRALAVYHGAGGMDW